MNSKAIKKQLLAAVAMVLVAAVALGSSTYAWFVASDTVTATGMRVQAMSEGGLAISYGGEAWGTSATAHMEDTTAKKLYPASTKDMTKWSHAMAADTKLSTAKADTYKDITSDVIKDSSFVDNNSYVVMKEFKIRSTATGSDAATGLYVKNITVTQNDQSDPLKTMSTALRVGVVFEAGQVDSNARFSGVYGPVSVTSAGATGGTVTNSATSRYNFVAYTGADPEEVTLRAYGSDGNQSLILNNQNKIPSSAEAPVTVKIFVWFEGEDANLYSDNFNVESLNISVDFASLPKTTSGQGG